MAAEILRRAQNDGGAGLRPTTVKELKRKRGAMGSPFLFAVSSRKRRETERVSGRRAPQKRCDQLLLRSKPGGVMLPSVAGELTKSGVRF